MGAWRERGVGRKRKEGGEEQGFALQLLDAPSLFSFNLAVITEAAIGVFPVAGKRGFLGLSARGAGSQLPRWDSSLCPCSGRCRPRTTGQPGNSQKHVFLIEEVYFFKSLFDFTYGSAFSWDWDRGRWPESRGGF